MRAIWVIVPLVMITVLVGSAGADASQQTIFFDDFTASQLSPLWQWQPQTPAPATQAGGFLTMVAIGSQSVGVGGTTLFLFANTTQTTSGLIGSSTPDGQYYQATWKMQPFNYTNQGGSVVKNAQVEIGFTTAQAAGSTFGFGAYIEESDSAIGNTNAILGQKSTVALWFIKPMASATNCFETKTMNNGEYYPCAVKNNATLYEPSIGRFDLNSIHVFTWTMRLFPVSHTSWVAFQMDADGWYNFTQASCSCIDGPTGTYQELYPFISLTYCGGLVVGSASCSATPPNQSVAVNLDYLLITNYPVVSLPTGQILSSGANPSTQGQALAIGQFSLAQFMQWEANSIAPGNIYAGGMILMGITCGMLFIGMGLASRKFGVSLSSFGFFYTIFAVGFSFFGFFVQILPVWIPVMTTIIMVAVTFGVIRIGGQSQGGFVPE